MYLMRLDDASEYMNIEKWIRMENLLDKYNIKPIYGIIPANEDPDLLRYEKVNDFWQLMQSWMNKGWIPALHGYTHVFETKVGGINPVNMRSEFAGVSIERQKEKIREGYRILEEHRIEPIIFFAPAHTFDQNTIKAIKEESSIRIISDTIANDVYFKDDFYFIPQQSGYCRKLPFKTVTFCYHPNNMTEDDFASLEKFLEKFNSRFKTINFEGMKKRKLGAFDLIIMQIYFARKKINLKKDNYFLN